MFSGEAHGGFEIGKLDVLIVEDDPISRRACARFCNLKGYHTDAVGSAEEALKKVSVEGLPQIALVDLDLPGMNGMELIRRFKDLNPLIFPVLITAASKETINSKRVRTSVTYLQKPVDVEHLMSLISEHHVHN